MDSTLPLISVIVPVYDVEAYLARCIESIIEQTYHNLEIVIINDGSPDGCPAIADEYAKKDRRIRLIHQENAGLAEARNVGMRLAHGSYLSFIDSDDFIDPDYYETLYRVLNSNDTDISICSTRVIDLSVVRPSQLNISEDLVLLSGHEALKELVNDNWLRNYVWDKLFKKELFEGIEFPKGRTFEDVAVMHKIFYRAKNVAITNEIKHNYIIRKNSITLSPSICNQYDCFLAHSERVLFFENLNNSELAQKEIIVALQKAMDASLQNIFHRTTPQEKTCLVAMKKWTDLYKNKLDTLAHENDSQSGKKPYFLYSPNLIVMRHASKYLFGRCKLFMKNILPVKLVGFFIKRGIGIRS